MGPSFLQPSACYGHSRKGGTDALPILCAEITFWHRDSFWFDYVVEMWLGLKSEMKMGCWALCCKSEICFPSSHPPVRQTERMPMPRKKARPRGALSLVRAKLIRNAHRRPNWRIGGGGMAWHGMAWHGRDGKEAPFLIISVSVVRYLHNCCIVHCRGSLLLCVSCHQRVSAVG